MTCCLDSRTALPVLNAIPPMLIMEHLVSSRPSFKLDNKDRLHARALAGSRTCVNTLNDHAFRKEVELAHGIQISDSRFQISD